MTAREIVDAVRGDVQVFSQGAPLVDGFPGALPTARKATSILAQVNRAYEELVLEGFQKCYEMVHTEAGRGEYRFPGMTNVYTVRLVDAAGTSWPMTRNTKRRLEDERPWHPRHPQGRPREYYFFSNVLGLFPVPDGAYTVRLLADVNPPRLAAEGDEPKRLDDTLQWALVAGAAYYIGRAQLALPAAQARFPELRAEWQEWKTRVREVVQSRDLAGEDDTPPLFEDPYRGASLRP